MPRGAIVAHAGDPTRVIYPRSSIKVIQALPLVESGAADALGFRRPANWRSPPPRIPARRITSRPPAPCSPPRDATRPASPAARSGPAARPTAVRSTAPASARRGFHNNCSGKHAGFVCAACHQGMDPAGYEQVDHPLHRQIAAALEDVTGTDLSAMPRGIDGCSIPVWGDPAGGDRPWLREARDRRRPRARTSQGGAAAARGRPRRALHDRRQPAGSAPTCRGALDGAAYVKIGAEGVYVATLPTLGLAIALKCLDGTARAAEVAVATLVAELLGRTDDPALAGFLHQEIKDWNGQRVGEVRAGEGF